MPHLDTPHGSPAVGWSLRDQHELDAMQARRKAFFEANRPRVIDAILVTTNTLSHNDPETMEQIGKMADRWIANADMIRDALAPFDSGFRLADTAQEG